MGIFDKDIGQASAPNYPTTGIDTNAYRGVAAEGIAGLAKGLGDMYIANQEAKKEAEASGALSEYQTALIEQENKVAERHAAQEESVATLNAIAAAEGRGEGGDALEELKAKAERLKKAQNQLGPGFDQRMLIERNLIKKRYLNDPRLAGMQKEINTIFGQERSDVSKFEDPTETKVRQIYGAGWTPQDYINVKRLDEHQAMQEKMLALGNITANRAQAAVGSIMATRLQSVVNAADAMYRSNGNFLTDGEIAKARTQIEQVYTQGVADVNKYLQEGVKQGYAMGDVQKVYNELTKAKEATLKFFEAKDFTTRLKLYQDTRTLMFEANKPDALLALTELAGMGGGSGGELAMLSALMQYPDRTEAALGKELADVTTTNARQLIDWMKKLQQVGDKPGFVPGFDTKFQAFVGAPLAISTPGTNDETKIGGAETATAGILDPNMKLNPTAYLDSYVNAKATYVNAAPEVQQAVVRHFVESTKVLQKKLEDRGVTNWKMEDGKIVLPKATPRTESADGRNYMPVYPPSDYISKDVDAYNRFVEAFTGTPIKIDGATQWLDSKRKEQIESDK